MKKEIILGYEVERKKIKNINLRIYPDRRIYISAPLNLHTDYIENFIRSKKGWIDEVQKRLDNLPKSTELQYVTGEKLSYLGRLYELEVNNGNENRIYFNNEKFIMIIKEDIHELKKKIVEKWYFEKAKVLFPKIMDKYLNLLGERTEHLSIKKMKTRWGSCNHRKKYINLNLELVKIPIPCIEYVVLHEIAHLRHPNHSKDFYYHIERYMPDYRQREKLLNTKFVV